MVWRNMRKQNGGHICTGQTRSLKPNERLNCTMINGEIKMGGIMSGILCGTLAVRWVALAVRWRYAGGTLAVRWRYAGGTLAVC